MDLSGLLQQIQARGKAVTDEYGRQALLSAARALVSALESPIERIVRLSWHNPTTAVAIRIAIDLNLFGKLLDENASPKTAAKLAETTGSDVHLLERLLKHLATGDWIKETGPDEYAPNAATHVLATPEATGMFVNCNDGFAIINTKLREFFKETGYQNPTDKDKSVFKKAANTDLHYFEWLFAPGNDEQANAFLNHMKFKTMARKWYETIPVDQILGMDCKPSDVLLIDVGGSTGQDILGFHKAHPKIPGRLILQDLPGTIETLNAEELKPVEPMSHDFFTPQPVKGAKAYYLKMVLHDWPDAQCRDILSNLKTALTPGHSKILINEIVIPDTGADWFTTSVDMLMMVTHSAQERREKHWTTLVESVGLKVAKIWQCGEAPERLIEIELA